MSMIVQWQRKIKKTEMCCDKAVDKKEKRFLLLEKRRRITFLRKINVG